MELTTTYLGLKLRSPLVVSASPLSESLDNIKRMDAAGAGAIVLFSLFEEQLEEDHQTLYQHLVYSAESHPEAQTYLPEPQQFRLGPAAYLEHIRSAKVAVQTPIIASLNCTSPGSWMSFAKQIEAAGADALELNIYNIPTDPSISGAQVEQEYVDILKGIKAQIKIPVAVKLSPHFSNIANMAHQLDQAGADGLVLFNRFYQPDIDLETLDVYPHILWSTSQALRLPLRWVAILYGHISANLAATSGIHRATDVIKMIMVGANVTQLCSALLRNGIGYIKTLDEGVREWMQLYDYESLEQMRGSLSQINCPDPSAFERAQYIRGLTTYTSLRQQRWADMSSRREG
jgi:dihydroorotate dehydrogenase (fumarate)